jgi:hypothetical protein
LTILDHFRALLTSLNSLLSCDPRRLSEIMIVIAINELINAYSIAVAPAPSARNRLRTSIAEFSCRVAPLKAYSGASTTALQLAIS